MKTKFTMIMAVIATFAISLNLHSSNEEVVFGAPAAVKVQEKVGIMVLLPINNQQFMWPVRNPVT